MKPANSVLSSYGTTIFEVMSGLAREHGAVNLGQGAPEGLEPADVLEVAARAAQEGPHQYPSMWGTPDLRHAIADHDNDCYGLGVDAETEVMVTSGATEALADCLFGLIEPGDEVVMIEPLYDSYLPIVQRAGGVPRLVRVEPPQYDLPREALAAAFSDKTKLLILNSPMNPCAKVFDREELGFIAGLLEQYDAYAVCDEVYEHLVYDGRQHVPLMSLPGMRERCARIGSFGKILSITSWKVGFIVAAPALMAPIAKTHQFINFTTPTCLQTAVAYGLRKGKPYFDQLVGDLQRRRDHLAAGLTGAGFLPMTVGGTYFQTVDFSRLGWDGTDADFCLHLTKDVGVAAVPVSAFYRQAEDGAPPPQHYIRFCFAKSDAALDEAVRRLTTHFG